MLRLSEMSTHGDNLAHGGDVMANETTAKANKERRSQEPNLMLTLEGNVISAKVLLGLWRSDGVHCLNDRRFKLTLR